MNRQVQEAVAEAARHGPKGDQARHAEARILGLVFRYGGAVLAVAVATGLRWLLQAYFGTAVAFITFFPTVALVAMLAGGGPSLLTAVLSAAIVGAWLGCGTGDAAGELMAMGLFIASGLIISKTAEMLRRARQREVAGLAEQVAERTSQLEQANARLRREIEDRQQAEKVLRESAERFRKVFNHAATGIAITDWEGRFEQCNPSYTALLGYTEQEFRQMVFSSLIHPEDREANLAELRRLRAAEVPFFEIENRYIHRNGEPVWVRKFVSILPDEDGKPAHQMALVTDITDRKQAEEALRESEERFRRLAEGIRLIPWEADASTWKFTYVGPQAADILGYPPDQWYADSRFWIEHIHPADRDWAVNFCMQRCAGDEQHFNFEYRMIAADGRVVWLHDIVNLVWDESRGGKLRGFLIDITDRKRAEQARRESEERMRAILNTAFDAIITINEQGIIQSVNPATERLFGYSSAEMMGRNVKMLMPSPYREEHDHFIRRYLETGKARMIGSGREVLCRDQDGRIFHADLTVSEVDHMHLFTGIIRDITRRKELEREVVEIASLEQRRIGQDLHDTVGQELTGLNLMAETLRADPPIGAEMIERIAEGLRRCQRELRIVLRGLLPVPVDAEGLMAALADLADRTQQEGRAHCTFDCPEPVMVADNLTATHLYLIAREAVHNAFKHACPRNIRITLESAARLVLCVHDDGIGMPAQPTTNQGVGLRIMRNRAAIIGAILTIEPATPTGTVVTCTLARMNRAQE